MDKEEIEKSIQERFDNLQPEIQDAIMNSSYEKNLYEIAQKHKLNIEQMGELEFNTTLVLLGQTHPDEYADELKEDLKLPEEKINEIVSDVNEKILKNIRELIKENFARDDEEEEAQAEVPLPPYSPFATENSDSKPSASPETKPRVIQESLLVKPEEPVSAPLLSKTESGLYQNAGIEVIDEEKGDDDLSKTIIGSKLSGATISKSVASDHSSPKVNGPVQATSPLKEVLPAKPHDPYHEAI